MPRKAVRKQLIAVTRPTINKHNTRILAAPASSPGRTIVISYRRVARQPITAEKERKSAAVPNASGRKSRAIIGIASMPITWARAEPPPSETTLLVKLADDFLTRPDRTDSNGKTSPASPSFCVFCSSLSKSSTLIRDIHYHNHSRNLLPTPDHIRRRDHLLRLYKNLSSNDRESAGKRCHGLQKLLLPASRMKWEY